MRRLLLLVLIFATIGCSSIWSVSSATEYRIHDNNIIYNNGYYRPFYDYGTGLIYGPWTRYYGDYWNWQPRYNWWYDGSWNSVRIIPRGNIRVIRPAPKRRIVRPRPARSNYGRSSARRPSVSRPAPRAPKSRPSSGRSKRN